MQVQVIHSLATVFSGIDHYPIAFTKALVAGNQSCRVKKMAKKITVLCVRIFEGCEMLARNDEDVHRRLRMNIREGVAELVLVDSG